MPSVVTKRKPENYPTNYPKCKSFPIKTFERFCSSHLPFDRALQVGLADCAVIDEYCRAGAVLFRQEPRGHLLKKKKLNKTKNDTLRQEQD